MIALFALAVVTTTENADLERSMVETCGMQVTRHARIKTMHGDSRLLIYDAALPPEQIDCLQRWAASWRHRIINGVGTYASHRYPLGPYELPPEARRNPK